MTPDLRLVDGLPGAITLLLLNDVLGNGRTAGVLRRLPLEVNAINVPVNDVRNARLSRGTCVGEQVKLPHEMSRHLTYKVETCEFYQRKYYLLYEVKPYVRLLNRQSD